MGPNIEWCLLGTLCLKSEVWAAWVQGVGSVLAIVAAGVIAWWQRHSDALRRAREERAAVRLCVEIGMRLKECFDDHAMLCELAEGRADMRAGAIRGLQRALRVLDEIASLLKGISVAQLPNAAVLALLNWRHLIVLARVNFEEPPPGYGWPFWEGHFGALSDRVMQDFQLLAEHGDGAARRALADYESALEQRSRDNAARCSA